MFTGKPIHIIYCLPIFLVSVFFGCSQKKTHIDEEALQELTDSLPEAPEDQVKALTEVEDPDSVDPAVLGRAEGTYIYISKPKMRLYVVNRKDSVLFSCGIACGAKKGNKEEHGDYRTPEGRFRVVGIYESTDWIHKTRDGRKVKGCYGPYFLSLATGKFAGIGIHGTNAPRSIGRRASEGCIRVNTNHIIYLKQNYAYCGMRVIISGETERLPEFIGLGAEDRLTPAQIARLIADSIARVAEADSLRRLDSLAAVKVAEEKVATADSLSATRIAADSLSATREEE